MSELETCLRYFARVQGVTELDVHVIFEESRIRPEVQETERSQDEAEWMLGGNRWLSAIGKNEK